MGVSKNRGTPKWMVKIMENPIKIDDLGRKPTILGNLHIPPASKRCTCPLRAAMCVAVPSSSCAT